MASHFTCTYEDCERPSRRVKTPSPCQACYMKHEYRQRSTCKAPECKHKLTWEQKTSRADYCRPHEGLIFSTWTEEDHQKAWNRVGTYSEFVEETGCWNWIGGQQDGYGRSHWPRDIRMTPHRFTYVWAFGGHPRRQVLDHLCNRSLCCNPLHVYPVPQTTNQKFKDIRDTDRSARWDPRTKEGTPPHQNLPFEKLMFALRWSGLEPRPW